MPTTITGTDGVSQVQAGAVESGDLPAEAYQKNNILGTVSESGGVPTGSIIERGSNANGEFVKYADGTMICTRVVQHDFSTSTFADFDYPASFEGNDDLPTAFSGTITSASFRHEAYKDLVVMARADTNWRVVTPSTSSETLPLALFVFGRWY